MGARLTKTVHAQGAPSVMPLFPEQPQSESTCDLTSNSLPPPDGETPLQVELSPRAKTTMDATVPSPADPLPQPTEAAMDDATVSNETNTEPTAPNPPAPAPPSGLTCVVCCTETSYEKESPRLAVRPCLSCHSVYCSPCIKELFTRACRDLSLMPPRCCVAIPLHKALPFLSQEEADDFRAKQAELVTPNPLYCPVARCSAFIPLRLLSPAARAQLKGKGPRDVDSSVRTQNLPSAACPQCAAAICTNCRAVAHPGTACNALDFGVGVDAATAEAIRGWGYKQCPRCGNGVKRMYGCMHMQCLCGAHFCWGCLDTTMECGYGCEEEDDDEVGEDDYTLQYNPIDTPPRRGSVAAETQAQLPRPAEDGVVEITIPPADDGALPPADDEPQPPADDQPQQPASDQPSQLSQPEDWAWAAGLAGLDDDDDNDDADEPSHPPTSPSPPTNLDSGTHWSRLDLNFGPEPTDDFVADCILHTSFSSSRIPLLQLAPSHDEACFAAGAERAGDMECMMCSRGIYPVVEGAGGANGEGEGQKADTLKQDVHVQSQIASAAAAAAGFDLASALAYYCDQCGIRVCWECRGVLVGAEEDVAGEGGEREEGEMDEEGEKGKEEEEEEREEVHWFD